MKLSEERKLWLREQLSQADYCHLGGWAPAQAWDVQQDLIDALDDIASLEALSAARQAELEAERDGARAANRALISQRGELLAEVRTLKSYNAKLEADKSILRRRLETKNGRLIGERIAELEAKIVLLMGETERAKEE